MGDLAAWVVCRSPALTPRMRSIVRELTLAAQHQALAPARPVVRPEVDMHPLVHLDEARHPASTPTPLLTCTHAPHTSSGVQHCAFERAWAHLAANGSISRMSGRRHACTYYSRPSPLRCCCSTPLFSSDLPERQLIGNPPDPQNGREGGEAYKRRKHASDPSGLLIEGRSTGRARCHPSSDALPVQETTHQACFPARLETSPLTPVARSLSGIFTRKRNYERHAIIGCLRWPALSLDNGKTRESSACINYDAF